MGMKIYTLGIRKFRVKSKSRKYILVKERDYHSLKELLDDIKEYLTLLSDGYKLEIYIHEH